MTDQKIPEVARIKDFIPTIEKRAKISLEYFLGKQPLTSLQAKPGGFGRKYYGEVNADGKQHGRGIIIWNDGFIHIGYFKNGDRSTGNYIHILSDGVFVVGEYYMKDGRLRGRGNRYKIDCSEEEYDY